MQPDPRTGKTQHQPPHDPWQTTRHATQPSGVPTQPQQHPPRPAAHPPVKRSNRGWIIAVIVAATLLGVGTLVLLVMVTVNPPAAHTVRFEVTAPKGQITLVNWSTLEDSALVRDPVSPWSHEVKMEARSGIVGVNVSGTGTVACKVWVDGKLVDEGESAGAVHCGATVR